MKERESELRERQIKALREKKEREMETLRSEQERETAKEKYEAILNEWSTDLAGEKKNIRTLLTTVSYRHRINELVAYSYVGRFFLYPYSDE